MAEVPIFQVDIFTNNEFLGNPAAVCPLPDFLDDSLLQAVARENNLAETAFIVPSDTDGVDFDLRWFTPNKEVVLCSHATIAAAYIVLAFLEPDWMDVVFDTPAGQYTVMRKGGLYSLRLKAKKIEEIPEPDRLREAMGGSPIKYVFHTGTIYHLVYENRTDVETMVPDFAALKGSTSYGFIASAPNNDEDSMADFVARCFYPALDIEEDPVTVSSYLYTAPYWAKTLDKKGLLAHQISRRGGQVWLEMDDNHVIIRGEATMISQGSLFIAGLDYLNS